MSVKGKMYWLSQAAPELELTRRRPKPKKEEKSPTIKNKPLAYLHDSIHMLRDGCAAQILMTILKDRLEYGGILFNFPPYVYDPPRNSSKKKYKTPEIPKKLFQPQDLLIMSTRPPVLSKGFDKRDVDLCRPIQEEGKRTLHITGAILEKIILTNLRKRVFDNCGRDTIVLNDRVFKNPHSKLIDLDYSAITFEVYHNAVCVIKGPDLYSVIKSSDTSEKEDFTIGYIIYLPKIQTESTQKVPQVPRLLCMFGLNGTSTLLFANLLYRKYSKHIIDILESDSARILMIRFETSFDKYEKGKILPFSLDDLEIKNDKIVNDLFL